MSSVSAVQLACPVCRKLMQIPCAAAGKVARCPACQSRLKIAADLQQLSLIQATPTQAPPTAAPPNGSHASPAPPNVLPSIDTSDTSKSTIKRRKRKVEKPAEKIEEKVVEKEPMSLKRKILWGLVGLTATTVVGLLALLVYTLTAPDPEIELSYIPGSCFAMVVIDNKTLQESEYYSSLQEEMPELYEKFTENFKEQIGTDFSNVIEITASFGVRNRRTLPVYVFKLEEPIDEADMPWNVSRTKSGYKEKKYGKRYVYYRKRSVPPMSLHIANKKTIVYAADELLHRAIVRTGKVSFSPRFQKIYDNADFSKPIVSMFDFKGYSKTFRDKDSKTKEKDPKNKEKDSKNKIPNLPGFSDLGFLKTFSMNVSLDSDFNLNATIQCKTSSDAVELREIIQSYLNFGRAISHRIKSSSVPEIRKYKITSRNITNKDQSLGIEAVLRCQSEKEAEKLKQKFDYFLYKLTPILERNKKNPAIVALRSVEVSGNDVSVTIMIDSDSEDYLQKLEGRLEELRVVLKRLLTSTESTKAAADSIEFKTEGSKLEVSLKLTPVESTTLLEGIFLPSGNKVSERKTIDLDGEKEEKSDDSDDEKEEI